jgi:hypothetical protein
VAITGISMFGSSSRPATMVRAMWLAVTTLVRRKDRFGRLYLAVIKPFPILMVPAWPRRYWMAVAV